MKRVIPLIAGAAALALVFTGCGGAKKDAQSGESGKSASTAAGDLKGEITFQTWSLKNDKFTPYFEGLVKTYQDAHPGTKIKWIDAPGDGYEDKLLQQVNSNELPDVVNLTDGFTFQLSQLDQLVNLTDEAKDVIGKYVPGALKGFGNGKEGSGAYAFPWYLGTDVSWWNTDQLKKGGVDKPPTTIDEYYADAKKAAESTKGDVKLISAMPDLSFLKEQGVQAMKDGKFIFNSPDAVKILQTNIDLYKAGAMPSDALNADYAGNAKLFTQGKVAYTTATGSFVSQLQQDGPTLLTNKQVDASPRITKVPPLFLQGLSVSAKSKNKALALDFAKFVTNNENQVAFVKLAQGFMPGTVEGNENPDSFIDKDADPLMAKAIKIAAAQMKTAVPNQEPAYTDDMKKYTGQQIALAFKGQLTAQQALDKSVEYANKNLDIKK